ncbi:unnamed protein product [Protopolystoma xenopodis]|uniref:Uncharacterized protein n=1 Tax=Protopolystoma xenopodis TaxID=117903 RepID=A0A448XK34_9PLAT|nr:unnamed protein product [Protopolystoma xenopodis]
MAKRERSREEDISVGSSELLNYSTGTSLGRGSCSPFLSSPRPNLPRHVDGKKAFCLYEEGADIKAGSVGKHGRASGKAGKTGVEQERCPRPTRMVKNGDYGMLVG